MSGAETRGFQDGTEFIGFTASPPPEDRSAEAGPSRNHSSKQSTNPNDASRQGSAAGSNNTGGPSKGKGKGKQSQLSAQDKAILAAKSGQRQLVDSGPTKKDGKGKGKKTDSAEESTGPSNLKEERRAAERGAPWTMDVDWERTRDPSEM